MVRSLLAPYEQRPWAQTNWILVRLWRVSLARAEAAVAAQRGGCPALLTSYLPHPGLWLRVPLHAAATPAENQARGCAPAQPAE